MRTIFFIIQKEFLQLLRDKKILIMSFAVPIIQLVILVNAATFELDNIHLALVDKDYSPTSKKLVAKFANNDYFRLKQYKSRNKANESLHNSTNNAILVIPNDFEENITRRGKGAIQININAINQNQAGIAKIYITTVIKDYIIKKVQRTIYRQNLKQKSIVSRVSYWFNQKLKYSNFMVPGILSVLVTIIGMFLTSMGIVKEKERGTIEQINVTPIKKHQFIVGKLIPFWIVGILELFFGIILGLLIFHIPIRGSVFLIFLSAAIYLIVVLGLGLYVSTITNTQQQAMFVTYFFMLIFILMSGLFTPIENMPFWAQRLNTLNPLRWFVRIMRMLFLKGSTFEQIGKFLLILTLYALAMISLATWQYDKTS